MGRFKRGLSNLMIPSEMIVATRSKGGRGRGALDQLTKDLKAVMKLLFQSMVPLKVVSVEEQREKAIAKLVKTINVTERSDSTAKTMSDKGMAGTSEARHCHLLFEFLRP